VLGSSSASSSQNRRLGRVELFFEPEDAEELPEADMGRGWRGNYTDEYAYNGLRSGIIASDVHWHTYQSRF